VLRGRATRCSGPPHAARGIVQKAFRRSRFRSIGHRSPRRCGRRCCRWRTGAISRPRLRAFAALPGRSVVAVRVSGNARPSPSRPRVGKHRKMPSRVLVSPCDSPRTVHHQHGRRLRPRKRLSFGFVPSVLNYTRTAGVSIGPGMSRGRTGTQTSQRSDLRQRCLALRNLVHADRRLSLCRSAKVILLAFADLEATLRPCDDRGINNFEGAGEPRGLMGGLAESTVWIGPSPIHRSRPVAL